VRSGPLGRLIEEDAMRRLISLLAGVGLVASIGIGPVAAGGPPSLSFYIDGARYRTIGTPTDFSNTGAPTSSFQPIYALGGDLINVATAGPGDPGYRGGRWMVLPIDWGMTTPVQLTSDEQVHMYAEMGLLTIATAPVKMFECPAIPVGGHG
jgi:hypothetical protein